MFGFHTPPMPGSHTEHGEDGSDGATTKNDAGSLGQHRAYSAHNTTTFGNYHANNFQQQQFPSRPQLRSPEYMGLLPDWDTRKVVPRPLHTFIIRLHRGTSTVQTFEKRHPDMKAVNNVQKYFQKTYSGLKEQCWASHIDALEAEVFEREDFGPKQCYYTLRATLRDRALTTLHCIEQGLEQPQWRLCIPPWYKAQVDDLYNVMNYRPFLMFSYTLRLVLLVVYFHRKFQKGSAQKS